LNFSAKVAKILGFIDKRAQKTFLKDPRKEIINVKISARRHLDVRMKKDSNYIEKE